MLNFQEKKYILASKVQEKIILIQYFPKKNYGKFRKKYFVMKRQKNKMFQAKREKKILGKNHSPLVNTFLS